MATFEIGGKEHELKLNYMAVGYLNKIVEGGSKFLVMRLLSGDTVDIIPDIIYASLLHTGEGVKKKDIEKELESQFNEQTLTLDAIDKIVDELVLDSFFYKPTVQSILKNNPDMKKAVELIRGTTD